MLYLAETIDHAPAATERALAAVDGYMFLGLPHEAQKELDAIRPEDQSSSPILRARVRVLLLLKEWQAASRLGERGCLLYPEDQEFVVQRVFSLHQLHRDEDALTLLLSAPDWIRRTGILHYNLACYEARLGDISTARQCIRVAIEMNAGIKASAETDPDLLPIWN